MSNHTYDMNGTCAKKVTFNLENSNVKDIHFTGGCNGNLKAIAELLEGVNALEAASKLTGITCGNKDTSCADQLAEALINAIAKEYADRSGIN